MSTCNLCFLARRGATGLPPVIPAMGTWKRKTGVSRPAVSAQPLDSTGSRRACLRKIEPKEREGHTVLPVVKCQCRQYHNAIAAITKHCWWLAPALWCIGLKVQIQGMDTAFLRPPLCRWPPPRLHHQMAFVPCSHESPVL